MITAPSDKLSLDMSYPPSRLVAGADLMTNLHVRATAQPWAQLSAIEDL
jgi:hypothetical protein